MNAENPTGTGTDAVAEHGKNTDAAADKQQAKAEQKIAEMAGNSDLEQAAAAAVADAEHRTSTP